MSILRLVDDIEMFALKSPKAKSWKKLKDDRMVTTFVIATEYNISRPMYFKHIPKWPLDCQITYFGANRTSFCQEILAFLPGAQEPIISQITKVVFVDRETRRPKLLPDWFKNSVGVRDKSTQDLKIKEFSRPSETFMRQVKVTWSDANEDHTYFLSYIKFGMETLKMAMYEEQCTKTLSVREYDVDSSSLHKTSPAQNSPNSQLMYSQTPNNFVAKNKKHKPDLPFKWMTKDIVQNGPKKMSIVFLNESLEGDLLNVHVWQEQGEELTVRCSVESLDHTPLCQFVTTFYGPSHQL